MYFFEPTSSERRGLIVLCVALLLILGVGGISYYYRNPSAATISVSDSLAVGTKHSVRRYFAVEERKIETFDFDPNTADSTTLLRLGFPPYMVRNIYKYRAKGGRYHEPDDLRRVYGMTNEMWDRLAPHVHIDRKYQYVEPAPRAYEEQPRQLSVREELAEYRDTVRYPVKLREGGVVSVNAADTNALKKIPGIGSYYARQIVRYRDQLGGFVSADQLQEIEGMPEDVAQWIRVDTTGIRRIDVNHATKNQLVRHPYLRVYRARAIWDRRNNYGPLHSIDDLRSMSDFSEADISRLKPYLEFK